MTNYLFSIFETEKMIHIVRSTCQLKKLDEQQNTTLEMKSF
jgi:hypothetical protein